MSIAASAYPTILASALIATHELPVATNSLMISLGLGADSGWNFRSYLRENLENGGFIAGNSNSIGFHVDFSPPFFYPPRARRHSMSSTLNCRIG